MFLISDFDGQGEWAIALRLIGLRPSHYTNHYPESSLMVKWIGEIDHRWGIVLGDRQHCWQTFLRGFVVSPYI